MCVCASFQAKQTAFTFSAQIGRNVDLELEIQKTIVGMRISILDITCVPMFSLNATTLNISAQSFPEKDLWFETEKNNVGTRINIVETFCVCQFSAKLDNFDFFGLNLAKNGFSQIWPSLDSESALPRYHVYQFSIKTENFGSFGPNLPKKEISILNSGN